MKTYFITIFIFTSLVSFGQDIRLDTIVGSSNEFFPIDSCSNYIYAVMSGWTNKKVDHYDTVSIKYINNWRDYKVIQTKGHRQLLSRHDSIFYKEPIQNRQIEISLLYWPVKLKDSRPIIDGGDVIAGKQYSEAIGYHRIGNKVYANCYKYTRQSDSDDVVIIANGIGIISIINRNEVKILQSIEKRKNCL